MLVPPIPDRSPKRKAPPTPPKKGTPEASKTKRLATADPSTADASRKVPAGHVLLYFKAIKYEADNRILNFLANPSWWPLWDKAALEPLLDEIIRTDDLDKPVHMVRIWEFCIDNNATVLAPESGPLLYKLDAMRREALARPRVKPLDRRHTIELLSFVKLTTIYAQWSRAVPGQPRAPPLPVHETFEDIGWKSQERFAQVLGHLQIDMYGPGNTRRRIVEAIFQLRFGPPERFYPLDNQDLVDYMEDQFKSDRFKLETAFGEGHSIAELKDVDLAIAVLDTFRQIRAALPPSSRNFVNNLEELD